MISLTNISSEEIKGVWYDKPYVIPAGETAEFEDGMAEGLLSAHVGNLKNPHVSAQPEPSTDLPTDVEPEAIPPAPKSVSRSKKTK